MSFLKTSATAGNPDVCHGRPPGRRSSLVFGEGTYSEIRVIHSSAGHPARKCKKHKVCALKISKVYICDISMRITATPVATRYVCLARRLWLPPCCARAAVLQINCDRSTEIHAIVNLLVGDCGEAHGESVSQTDRQRTEYRQDRWV